tara:strand:+ start:5569 stop:6312 length:744 start_codon:yes stop_codon:yes gene_type:complete
VNESIIFEKEYEVSLPMININGKLGIFGLLNIIQDLSSQHAEVQGFGYEAQIKLNKFWVLVGQRIQVKKWPKWNDKLRFKTWIRLLSGKIVYRDIEFYLEDNLIGECSVSWLLMDGETRKMAKLEDFPVTVRAREDYCLPFKAEKLVKRDEFQDSGERIVRVTDLDINNHVNNTKYTQWVLDTIELQYHKKLFLSEFEINFLSEAKLDDHIKILRSEKGASEVDTQFVGLIKGSDKPVFVSNFKGKF